MTDKRRLYKENNELVLNEDGTEKTLEQKIEELNQFVKTVTQELESKNKNSWDSFRKRRAYKNLLGYNGNRYRLLL